MQRPMLACDAAPYGKQANCASFWGFSFNRSLLIGKVFPWRTQLNAAKSTKRSAIVDSWAEFNGLYNGGCWGYTGKNFIWRGVLFFAWKVVYTLERCSKAREFYPFFNAFLVLPSLILLLHDANAPSASFIVPWNAVSCLRKSSLLCASDQRLNLFTLMALFLGFVWAIYSLEHRPLSLCVLQREFWEHF